MLKQIDNIVMLEIRLAALEGRKAKNVLWDLFTGTYQAPVGHKQVRTDAPAVTAWFEMEVEKAQKALQKHALGQYLKAFPLWDRHLFTAQRKQLRDDVIYIVIEHANARNEGQGRNALTFKRGTVLKDRQRPAGLGNRGDFYPDLSALAVGLSKTEAHTGTDANGVETERREYQAAVEEVLYAQEWAHRLTDAARSARTSTVRHYEGHSMRLYETGPEPKPSSELIKLAAKTHLKWGVLTVGRYTDDDVVDRAIERALTKKGLTGLILVSVDDGGSEKDTLQQWASYICKSNAKEKNIKMGHVIDVALMWAHQEPGAGHRSAPLFTEEVEESRAQEHVRWQLTDGLLAHLPHL